MSNWNNTDQEVRVSIRNIDVIFQKEDDCIGVAIYKQGDVGPLSITRVPLEGESDDIQHE